MSYFLITDLNKLFSVFRDSKTIVKRFCCKWVKKIRIMWKIHQYRITSLFRNFIFVGRQDIKISRVKVWSPVDINNLVKIQAILRGRNARKLVYRHQLGVRTLLVYRRFWSSEVFIQKKRAVRCIEQAWIRYNQRQLDKYLPLRPLPLATPLADTTYPPKLTPDQVVMQYYQLQIKNNRENWDELFESYFQPETTDESQLEAKPLFVDDEPRQATSSDPLNPIINTAFPRLGAEFIDGCDCWLQCAEIAIPRRIELMVFGRFVPHTTSFRGDLTGVRYGQNFNKIYVCIVPINDTYYVYSISDCHQQEAIPGLLKGHIAQELAILRLCSEQIVVLKFISNDLTQHMEVDQVDQHNHVTQTRSVITSSSSQSNDTGVMVESRGELMTREEKARRRRERRNQNAQLRAEGKKPMKIQVPFWAQGLTNQEYKEVRQQRLDYAQEQWKSYRFKSLPQEVRMFFKTPAGNEQWLDIHRWMISRPDFAQQALAKLNRHLTFLGLTFPLTINENIVENMKNEIRRKNELKSIQLSAKQRMRSNHELAQKDWHDKQRKRFLGLQKKSIDWSIENDDELPSLEDWGIQL